METETVNPRYIVRRVSNPTQWVVIDTHGNYTYRTCGDNQDWAWKIADEQNERWNKMVSATEHHASTRVQRTGGSMIRGGGHYRESEAHCSCGWSETQNGQTYAESMQAIREHLKEMGVYTTPLEQTVYAHVPAPGSPTWLTPHEIAHKSEKTFGRVQKALDKLVERGNVEKVEPGLYRRTDKWFSWND